MLGWFRPRCPVDAQEKTWIELRMSWLAEQFGLERMRAATVVLPTHDLSAPPAAGGEAGLRQLHDRLCRFLDIDPAEIDLSLVDDETFGSFHERLEGTVIRTEGWSGIYQLHDGRAIIHLARSLLAWPEGLISTLIHELAHHLLIGGGRLTGEEEDHEQVADLLPVFLGLGVFRANSVMREGHSPDPLRYSWVLSRHGYLTARHHGYALALFAWFRGEDKPEWARFLRLDAQASLTAGLKYLLKTGDSRFHPDEGGPRYAHRTTTAVFDDVTGGSDGARVAGLWELRDRRLNGKELTDAVERAAAALRHANPIVRSEAAGTLDALGTAARTAVPMLVKALDDSHARVRMAAAFALGHIDTGAQDAIEALTDTLRDRQPAVANAAAWALARFGRSAEAAAPLVVRLLRTGLVECQYALLDQALETICAISDDAEHAIAEELGERDSDLCQQALQALAERRLTVNSETA
ncbi:MAG: HEAT repeat domain-containing protein [Planctomycetes bacterium]|nr:HEAT repeat domain-containing protein [Planctomycetota bacterium]